MACCNAKFCLYSIHLLSDSPRRPLPIQVFYICCQMFVLYSYIQMFVLYTYIRNYFLSE